jgi:prephenate dehydrogenase
MTDVALIGLGPIGLSLAQATRAAFSGAEIVGFDPDKGRAHRAQESGVLDAVTDRLPTALAGASLVIVDAPLNEMEPALESIGKLATPSCIVTDTSPLKRPVLNWAAQSLPPSMGFVGGHVILQPTDRPDVPLTTGATYCVVCDADAPAEAIDVVVALALAAGARPLFIDADEHDSFVLATDYLPKIAMGAAIDAAVRSPVWRDMQNLRNNPFGTNIPGSFAANLDERSLGDVTTLGAAHAGSLLFWIDRLRSELRSMRDSVEKAVAAGEMVDFDGLDKERLESLMQPPPQGVRIERPGLQSLLLGDWLSARSKQRRGS